MSRYEKFLFVASACAVIYNVVSFIWNSYTNDLKQAEINILYIIIFLLLWKDAVKGYFNDNIPK